MNVRHKFSDKLNISGNINYNYNKSGEQSKNYTEQYLPSENLYSLGEIENVNKNNSLYSSLGIEWEPDKKTYFLFDITYNKDYFNTIANNNTNYATYLFWYGLGAKRVVSARELSIAEIKEIREHIPDDLEIETFIHGAMCISYSGRCLLSNYFTGRDANQGACTHPCRWKYSIVEETRPNEYMPVYENERGTYIFNSKDLCMIEHIPDLFDAGIDSFKIEGRMKTALYVATVARTYRKAIDDYKKSPELYQQNMPWYLDQISNCTYRQFTTGFFYGKPSDEAQIYDNNTYLKEYTYLGIVGGTNEEGLYRIEQRNKFSVGEQIEVMKPDGENIEVTVRRIVDEEGNDMESAPHPKQVLYIDLGHPLEMYDILRRKE